MIPHRNRNQAVSPAHTHLNIAAAPAVLDGVVEQVPKRPRQRLGIGGDRMGSGIGAAFESKTNPVRFATEFLGDVMGEHRGIHRAEVVRAPARFHPSEIQQRFDQPVQALGRARLRLIEDAAVLWRRAIILREQLGKLAKRGQRRPEFVRHGGDEIRLKPGDSHFTIHRAPDEIASRGDQNHERRKTDCEIAALCDEFLWLRLSGRARDDDRPRQPRVRRNPLDLQRICGRRRASASQIRSCRTNGFLKLCHPMRFQISRSRDECRIVSTAKRPHDRDGRTIQVQELDAGRGCAAGPVLHFS